MNQQVRTVLKDGEPWFVAKDVAEALVYKDTSDALATHVDIDDTLKRGITDSGQRRQMYIITYEVIVKRVYPNLDILLFYCMNKNI